MHVKAGDLIVSLIVYEKNNFCIKPNVVSCRLVQLNYETQELYYRG